MGQGFTKVFNDDLIDTGPTARNSSTDATMLDERIDQIHTPFLKPQLPSIAERNHSVLTCPTGACNLNTFEEPPSIEESLQIFDDEVFSPPVTLINYPILFNFLNQPHSQAVPHDDVEVMKANQHDVVVQPPPEPPDEYAELTSRLCTSMKVKKEGIRGSWREIGDRERRGAPDS